jgi:hypothetical protein
MKRIAFAVATVLVAGASYALGAATPPGLVSTYSALADVILGAKNTEHHLVHAILEGHHAHAGLAAKAGNWEEAAAEMALFANEGDNAVGGIRKRLLEGGHHHNAEGEAKGIFEPGYVIVTIQAKKDVLSAVSDLRAATADPARKAAWDRFDALARGVLGAKK